MKTYWPVLGPVGVILLALMVSDVGKRSEFWIWESVVIGLVAFACWITKLP